MELCGQTGEVQEPGSVSPAAGTVMSELQSISLEDYDSSKHPGPCALVIT